MKYLKSWFLSRQLRNVKKCRYLSSSLPARGDIIESSKSGYPVYKSGLFLLVVLWSFNQLETLFPLSPTTDFVSFVSCRNYDCPWNTLPWKIEFGKPVTRTWSLFSNLVSNRDFLGKNGLYLVSISGTGTSIFGKLVCENIFSDIIIFLFVAKIHFLRKQGRISVSQILSNVINLTHFLVWCSFWIISIH